MNTLRRLWQEDGGQDLIEYGLLLVLIALIAITTIKGLGTQLSTIFSSATAALQNPIGGSSN